MHASECAADCAMQNKTIVELINPLFGRLHTKFQRTAKYKIWNVHSFARILGEMCKKINKLFTKGGKNLKWKAKCGIFFVTLKLPHQRWVIVGSHQIADVQNIIESSTSLLYHHFNLFNNLNDCKYVPLLCLHFLALVFSFERCEQNKRNKRNKRLVLKVDASDRFHALFVRRKVTKMAQPAVEWNPMERNDTQWGKSNIELNAQSSMKFLWNTMCYLDQI